MTDNEKLAREACEEWGWDFCCMSPDDLSFNYTAPGMFTFMPLWFEVARIPIIRERNAMYAKLPEGFYLTWGDGGPALAWKRALNDDEAAQAARAMKEHPTVMANMP